MPFVVIVKTFAEARTKNNTRYPDSWPKICVEFDSLEEAREHYPDKPIMTVEQYNTLQKSLVLLPEKKKYWFQFWK